MSSLELLPEVAEALDRLIPPESDRGDWNDVLLRAGQRRGVRRALSAGHVAWAIAALIVVIVAGAAAYVILSHESSRRPQPGALTLTAGGYNVRWPVRILEVEPNGRTVVIWQCPERSVCGEPEGIDWSPDGRHVAFTLDAFNIVSRNLGLHVLDIETGRDKVVLRQHDSAGHRSPDCPSPATVAWSPDGRTLAFDCAAFEERSRIWLVSADGTHRRRVSPIALDASSPSWSPDGTRIAFAAGGIYTIRTDGKGLRLVAVDGSAPDWSPDGKEIAYSTSEGIRLITPDGRDVTPSQHFGIAGVPAWSPDGRQLAITASGGGALYLLDLHSNRLRHVPVHRNVGSLGPRPAWYPTGRTSSSSRPATNCQSC